MLIISILAYLADLAVLSTYALMIRGQPVRWLNWANGLGAFPIGISEILTSAYPAFVLTVAFGLLGWWGVLRGKNG